MFFKLSIREEDKRHKEQLYKLILEGNINFYDNLS